MKFRIVEVVMGDDRVYYHVLYRRSYFPFWSHVHNYYHGGPKKYWSLGDAQECIAEIKRQEIASKVVSMDVISES